MDNKSDESNNNNNDKISAKEIEKLKLQLALPSTSNRDDDSSKRKKAIVLEEDEYREKLDQIIERDFFPDVEKLRFELEYNEAIENNDFEKLHKLNDIKERIIKSAATATPASFETPSIRDQYLKRKKNESNEASDKNNTEKEMTLNKFLNKYTSEDNDALEYLLKADRAKQEAQMKYITKDGQINNSVVDKMIELPSIDEQRALKNGPGNMENRSVTWKYKDRNNVMFVPDEAPLTEDEIAKRVSSRPIVMHQNTRFKKKNIFPHTETASSSSSTNADNLNNSGRVGIDGNPISGDSTPQIGGFKFVPTTPLIDPNHLDTPNQMTWGTIDATPIRLEDGSATPRSGAFFKIPEIAKRELLEQELHAQILSKKRKQPSESSSSSKNSSLNFNSSQYDRLSTMSPAAQRLASNTLRIGSSNDRSLRASYSTFSGLKNPSSSRHGTITPSPLGENRPSRTPIPKHFLSNSKS